MLNPSKQGDMTSSQRFAPGFVRGRVRRSRVTRPTWRGSSGSTSGSTSGGAPDAGTPGDARLRRRRGGAVAGNAVVERRHPSVASHSSQRRIACRSVFPSVAVAGQLLLSRSQSPAGGAGIQPQRGAVTTSSVRWAQAPGRCAYRLGEMRIVSAGNVRHSCRGEARGRAFGVESSGGHEQPSPMTNSHRSQHFCRTFTLPPSAGARAQDERFVAFRKPCRVGERPHAGAVTVRCSSGVGGMRRRVVSRRPVPEESVAGALPEGDRCFRTASAPSSRKRRGYHPLPVRLRSVAGMRRRRRTRGLHVRRDSREIRPEGRGGSSRRTSRHREERRRGAT